VIEAALASLEGEGHEVVAAVLAGGKEKLPVTGLEKLGDAPVRSGGDPRALLDAALRALKPDAVLDLSDEPVLDYRRRHQLAAVALYRNVPYEGADFLFTPPARPQVASKPSLAIVGTGKRTGKTAVAAHVARALKASDANPVVVAMGRGGPAEPEVLRGDRIRLTPADLVELSDVGKHAASDYVEDALLARVPTVGCFRCGGGLAGGVTTTNVERGVEVANRLEGDILLLEGSGSTIPPVAADVTGLVVPASIPEEYLTGYMGPYRMLLADFVVVTMCENPFGSPSQISATVARIVGSFRAKRGAGGEETPRVVRTVFRPTPTQTVEGASVYVATTAPEAAGASIRHHLETEHGCRVIGITHSLSDRAKLAVDLERVRGRAEVMLCEIKAAAIDVATRKALDDGMEVVYLDNTPRAADDTPVDEVIQWAAAEAKRRFRNSSEPTTS
jgi:cyclic 2,3-diphosphoglycerate synthetase